ncbi:MAG TPA: hypothetical protein DCY79_01750, partial [Planctomycetaceae bacterium]|nr:hypothetical protein [Planctomycetaceae bacterium]
EPLWLGSLMLGLLFGYIVYYVAYHGVRSYRLRRWGQLVPPTSSDGADTSADTGAATLGVVGTDDEDGADDEDAA